MLCVSQKFDASERFISASSSSPVEFAERLILGTAEDFSTSASEQPKRCSIVNRLGEEADMTVGEQEVGSTGVEAVGFIIIPTIHDDCATESTLDRTIALCAVEAERSFTVCPANSLVVVQVFAERTSAVNAGSATAFDNHNGVGRAV